MDTNHPNNTLFPSHFEPYLLLLLTLVSLFVIGCGEQSKYVVIGLTSSRAALNANNTLISSIHPKRDPTTYRSLQITIDQLKLNNQLLEAEAKRIDLLHDADLEVISKNQLIQQNTPIKVFSIYETKLRKLEEPNKIIQQKKATLEFNITHLRAELILDRKKRSNGKIKQTDVAIDLDVMLRYKCELPVDLTKGGDNYVLALDQDYIQSVSIMAQHSENLAKNGARELFIDQSLFKGDPLQQVGLRILGRNTLKPLLNTYKCLVQ